MGSRAQRDWVLPAWPWFCHGTRALLVGAAKPDGTSKTSTPSLFLPSRAGCPQAAEMGGADI